MAASADGRGSPSRGDVTTLLPLPACGERVGVRGRFHEGDSLRANVPFAKLRLVERPPHPEFARRAQIPTSPRKRGEGRAALQGARNWSRMSLCILRETNIGRG